MREGVGQNVHGRIVEWKPIKHFFEPIGYKRENGAGTKMKFSMEDVRVVCRRELVQGKSIANVGPSYLRGHKVHRGGIPRCWNSREVRSAPERARQVKVLAGGRAGGSGR